MNIKKKQHGLKWHLLTAIIFATVLVNAQSPEPKLLFAQSLDALHPYGAGADSVVSLVPVKGQSFTKALQVNTFKRADKAEYGIKAPINTALHKGDVLWISFKARSLESRRETGESFVELRFDQLINGKYTWPSYVERGISIGPEWTETSVLFVLSKDVQPAEVQFIIKFDTYPQRFEISPVTFASYGPDIKLTDLPRSVIHYGGDRADAPWRKAAAERIEKYRKGDLNIKVTDAKGQPVKGATVEVKMIRNAFTFGTATSSQRLLDTASTDSQKYRDTLLKYFNQVVLENEIKSKNWDRFNYAQTSKGIAWLKAHQLPVRGHVMVWPSWEHAGPAFAKYQKDTTGLRTAILKIIKEQTATMKGWFTEWDVVNEPYAHHDFLNILGREEMLNWYAAARSGTPGVKLFLNDYTMFHGSGPGSASENFYDNVKFLLDNGAPLQAIGEQGHIGGTPPDIPFVLERLDHFAKLGLPIQISEFDINSNDDDFKARYLGDFLTAIYSHPATIGFVQWGFWEAQHWFPVAALWNKDWTPRANGKVFATLVTQTWHTEEAGQTDTNGNYAVRGFTGTYEVSVKNKGKEVKQEVTLSDKDQSVSVQVKG